MCVGIGVGTRAAFDCVLAARDRSGEKTANPSERAAREQRREQEKYLQTTIKIETRSEQLKMQYDAHFDGRTREKFDFVPTMTAAMSFSFHCYSYNRSPFFPSLPSFPVRPAASTRFYYSFEIKAKSRKNSASGERRGTQ